MIILLFQIFYKNIVRPTKSSLFFFPDSKKKPTEILRRTQFYTKTFQRNLLLFSGFPLRKNHAARGFDSKKITMNYILIIASLYDLYKDNDGNVFQVWWRDVNDSQGTFPFLIWQKAETTVIVIILNEHYCHLELCCFLKNNRIC